MYYVYIIKSLVSDHYYVGQTDNLATRLKCHNSNKVYWTKRYSPWKIIYKESYQSRNEALRRESYFNHILEETG